METTKTRTGRVMIKAKMETTRIKMEMMTSRMALTTVTPSSKMSKTFSRTTQWPL